jgi:hypothetical protein
MNAEVRRAIRARDRGPGAVRLARGRHGPGVDVFAALSNGQHIQPADCGRRALKALARAQRSLAPKKRSSNNRRKVVVREERDLIARYVAAAGLLPQAAEHQVRADAAAPEFGQLAGVEAGQHDRAAGVACRRMARLHMRFASATTSMDATDKGGACVIVRHDPTLLVTVLDLIGVMGLYSIVKLNGSIRTCG